MCGDYCIRVRVMEVLEIHRYPQLMDQCCDLINMEWPRSKTARLRRLEMSCDSFPTCLVLVCSNEVLGHSKLSSLPSLPLGCLIESVVVHPEHRGKGLGKFLMTKSEDHARRQGMETLYLYTKDKQGFYSKIGYTECEPVQIYGQHVLGQNSKNVPFNETDAKGNFNVPAQVVSPTALSVPPVSNMYPQTKTLIQCNTCPQCHPPPPPPPPPPLPPKPVYLATLRPSYTWMKKNL